MTQHSEASSDSLTLLRNFLHRIAVNPSLDEVGYDVLQSACAVVGAEAGFYLLFDSPRWLGQWRLDGAALPDDDLLQRIAYGLEDDLNVGSTLPEPLDTLYDGWLLIPLRQQDYVAGLLVLFYRDTLHAFDTQLLTSLIDMLKILTIHAQSAALHQKLTRNQNEFVRITTHDLRSPLTAMLGFASMLESDKFGDLNERQAHFVDKILSGVTQMSSLVDNIQDAGRYDPQTGFYEMEREPTDTTQLVRDIVETHLLPAEKQELTLTVNVDDNVPIINADAGMLKSGITNLVDNAIKYTPNGGHIEVGVGLNQDHNKIYIYVKDDGYGISEDNLRQLFERHFRIHRREHTRVKGSGLGLFIVRSVAIRHGGRAWVESEEGQGSTFFISVPLKGKNLIGHK